MSFSPAHLMHAPVPASACPPGTKRSTTPHERSESPTATAASLRIKAAPDGSIPLIWMLGTALCFLAVGISGFGRPIVDLPDAAFAPASALVPELPVEDLTIADFVNTTDESGAPAADKTVVAPPVEAPPEPAPALAAEDVIVDAPNAPEIETALTWQEPASAVETKPVRRKDPPKPAPAPRLPARTETSQNDRPAATPQRGSGVPGSTGATAGAAKPGRGGKGKFPTPPYPSFARQQGLTGTVYLTVRVASDGSASSVSVTGSSGSSQLDHYAASFVQSRWRWPAGEARSFRLPLRFHLR